MDGDDLAVAAKTHQRPGILPRFYWDAQALLPTYPHGDAQRCRRALLDGGRTLVDHIVAQGVAPLWHYRLKSGGLLMARRSRSPCAVLTLQNSPGADLT
jgi:hypothetical protein